MITAMTTTRTRLITKERPQHRCDVCKEPATMGHTKCAPDGTRDKTRYGCKLHPIKIEGIV